MRQTSLYFWQSAWECRKEAYRGKYEKKISKHIGFWENNVALLKTFLVTNIIAEIIESGKRNKNLSKKLKRKRNEEEKLCRKDTQGERREEPWERLFVQPLLFMTH